MLKKWNLKKLNVLLRSQKMVYLFLQKCAKNHFFSFKNQLNMHLLAKNLLKMHLYAFISKTPKICICICKSITIRSLVMTFIPKICNYLSRRIFFRGLHNFYFIKNYLSCFCNLHNGAIQIIRDTFWAIFWPPLPRMSHFISRNNSILRLRL